MRVTIMFRDWHGKTLTAYPVSVEIADTCPVCGGPRGEPYPYRFCEDADWLTVDQWKNPCHHIDTYEAVYREAMARTRR